MVGNVIKVQFSEQAIWGIIKNSGFVCLCRYHGSYTTLNILYFFPTLYIALWSFSDRSHPVSPPLPPPTSSLHSNSATLMQTITSTRCTCSLPASSTSAGKGHPHETSSKLSTRANMGPQTNGSPQGSPKGSPRGSPRGSPKLSRKGSWLFGRRPQR